MYYTEKFNPDTFTPARFESQGVITLRGQEIPYHTVCEDNVFYNQAGKPIASVFSYSYFRSDVKDPASRPVIFAYNGGPGSASMFVHAGFFGPKRLQYDDAQVDRPTSLPPYTVIDNPDCLLDVADLVMVEPVGTGYGLLLDDTCADQFYGIEEDAEALLTFIEQWLHRYQRWLSPKYLAGESYGCTRSATAAGIASNGGKNRAYGVRFDGIVMIGNTVTTGKYFGVEVPVPDAVLNFPTFAATNWYHRHPSEQTVEAFTMEAKAFADNEYLLALYQGEALQGEKRQEVIRKISYYTGMTPEFLENNALNIPEETFRQELLKDQHKAVARYDGRFTRPLYVPQIVEERNKSAIWDDASSDRYDAFFYAVLTGVINPLLNVHLDRAYISSSLKYRDWNKKCEGGTTAERLRDAMNTTFGMRTFFANGWYDNCTEIGWVYYTITHAGLPMDRVSVKGYPSGHMIYIGEQNTRELSEDIRRFLAGENPTNTL